MPPSSYRMPAEWQPHRACLLLCPHNAATFRLARVRAQFLHVARTIAAAAEEVVLGCHDEAQLIEYRELISKDDPSIHCALCPSNDSWARDTGPTFVLDRNDETKLQALDWDFNAYGGPNEGCYWPCEQDKQVASRFVEIVKTKKCIPASTSIRKIPLVLEGGSIHTDGQATILTTAECLLNKNRNPHKSKKKSKPWCYKPRDAPE